MGAREAGCRIKRTHLMSRGSGQDAAILTIATICKGSIICATGEIDCELEGMTDVFYQDGEAAWTCDVCGTTNVIEMEMS
jgi:hypothetical protein